jgi:hypothetical protein
MTPLAGLVLDRNTFQEDIHDDFADFFVGVLLLVPHANVPYHESRAEIDGSGPSPPQIGEWDI